MKKIKILCLRTSSKQASYRYRIEQFLPNWHQYNIDFNDQLIVGKSFFQRIKLIKEAQNYDFVFLHKKTLSAFFIRMIKNRSKLIFDYDDALYAIESYKKSKPKDSQPGSKTMIRRLNNILRQADLVFAGSTALKDYANQFSKHVYLVPTALAKPDIITQKKDEVITIGWIGNRYNLYFLEQIDDACKRIQNEFNNIKFSVMCDQLPDNTNTNWQFAKWSRDAELDWLNSIDIGLMPLNDDEWSRGKCAFKLIQYMSHKKVVIASNVGENKRAVIDKSGFLVDTNEDWYTAIKYCIQHADQLTKMGETGYNYFLEQYELSKIQRVMADLFQSHVEKT